MRLEIRSSSVILLGLGLSRVPFVLFLFFEAFRSPLALAGRRPLSSIADGSKRGGAKCRVFCDFDLRTEDR